MVVYTPLNALPKDGLTQATPTPTTGPASQPLAAGGANVPALPELTPGQLALLAQPQYLKTIGAPTASNLVERAKGDPNVERRREAADDIELAAHDEHGELKNASAFTCFSHTDAIASAPCQKWCAANEKDCIAGRAGQIFDACRRRVDPKSGETICGCVKEAQQHIVELGNRVSSVFADAALNARIADGLLHGPYLNDKCSRPGVKPEQFYSKTHMMDSAKRQCITILVAAGVGLLLLWQSKRR
jgi:hypothetical protein